MVFFMDLCVSINGVLWWKYQDLPEEVKRKFLRNVSFLYISWVFVTEDAVDIKFSIFYNKLQRYPVAKKFIDEKLILNRKKQLRFLQNIFSPQGIQVANVQNHWAVFL